MKKLYVGVSLVAVMIGGCATYTPAPPKVYLNQYDPESAKALISKDGKNSISGNAFLRQKGGGIVTCAGSDVNLFPKTAHSTEYLEEKFKNEYYFYGTFSGGKGYKQSGDYLFNPYSVSGSKETQCDSQGNFEFTGVGDGEYYVITRVNWSVPSKYGPEEQGGNLVQQVKVIGNETKKVVLSN
jgi:hypothetical protein